MRQKQKAERQAFLVRWIVAAAVAVLISDAVPGFLIASGFALLACDTALSFWVAAVSERYERHERWAGNLVCAGDIAMSSLAVMVSHGSVPNLSLIFILPIVWSGYAASRKQTIAFVTIASLACNFVAAWVAHPSVGLVVDLASLRVSSVAFLAASGVAAVLFIFKGREDTMERRNRKLSSLLDFGSRFTNSEDVARLMEQTLRAAIADTDAASGYIMLVDEKGESLTTEVAVSLGEERSFPDQKRIGEGIEGYVLQTGKPLMLAQERSSVPAEMHYEGQAVLSVPMIESGGTSSQNGVIGVFTLFKYQAGTCFLDEDIDLVRTVVGLTTMAIINSRLYESQQASFLRSLQAFANTLEAKDAYTQGHSYRVSQLCMMMAKRLHVVPELVEDLCNGALLHDIGKIGIPDAILSKPGHLTDEEFVIMKSHPAIGYEICKPLGLNDGILMLIRNHHEKLDGTGYPDGLKLGELPLMLRIICVADAFDAMSSSRPYRKTIDSRIRNEQLNRFAGTQFDPLVVEALKWLLHNGDLHELYKDHWQTNEENADSAMLLLKAA